MYSNEYMANVARIEAENKKHYSKLPKYWHYDRKGRLLPPEKIKEIAKKKKFYYKKGK